MPFFQTGNTGWDQGLNGLAGSLFPDPSKQAQAGYYGAETAQAIIKSRQMQDQMTQAKTLTDLFTPGATPGVPPGQPGQPPAAPVAPPAPPPLASDPSVPMALPGPAPVAPPAASQPPGGGVKMSPPAAANGSPAPVALNLPYLVAMGARAGWDPNVIANLGRAWVNEQIKSGAMDQNTGLRFLSGAGDSAPLNAQTQITTTGMNNRTQITTTGMNNRNALELKGMDPQQTYNEADPLHPNITPLSKIVAPGAPGFQAPNVPQATEDAKPIVVVTPSGQRITTTVGALRANPAMGRPENAADQQPMTTAVGPDKTPTVTSTGQATTRGDAPYDPKQSEYDKQNISIVTPNGEVRTTTEGELRANPNLGRRYDPVVDGGLVQSKDANGRAVFTLTRNAAGQPAAQQSTDAAAADVTSRVGTATEQGDTGLASKIVEGAQAGQSAIAPKTRLTPQEDSVIEKLLDDTVAKTYPPESGMNLTQNKDPAALSPADRAEATRRINDRMIRDPHYRANPAAAVDAVIQEMQKDGTIPAKADRRVGFIQGNNPNVTGGKVPRFIVQNPARPGAATPSLTDTVAPRPGTPAASAVPAPAPTPAAPPGPLPAGALSPAPSGAPEGQVLQLKGGGGTGVVRGGFVYPAPGSAAR